MASPTRWTWVWVNSGSWWWTGRTGVLRFMGSQRVGHDWATELNWTENQSSQIKEATFLFSMLCAKSLQSCPTLVWPHRRQPTRFPRPWDSPGKNTGVGAISFSNAWNGRVKVKSLSLLRLFATPWTAAYQAPPSMGFSRQEYWWVAIAFSMTVL